MKLIDKLKGFEGGKSEALDAMFKDLAASFLYGGYICIADRYRIYLRTVEFYYYQEGKEGSVDNDNIMYHRNNKSIEGEIPYLPPMTLYAHDSGYDIAFENEAKHFRASALIREYAVYDMKQDCFMKWDSSVNQFRCLDRGVLKYNNQSTYLKLFLNGFSLTQSPNFPVWVDVEGSGEVQEGKFRKGIKNDTHKWSFTRKEDYCPCFGNSRG